MLKKIDAFLQRHATLARYVPLIFWIAVIFFMSSGEASMAQTSRFIRPLLEFLFPDASAATLNIYHAYIRKCAHFAEYAVLAFLAARAFWSATIGTLSRRWAFAAFGVVLLIAAIDELNQSFDPSRTGSVWDVALDCFGGATALFVLLLVSFRRGNMPVASSPGTASDA